MDLQLLSQCGSTHNCLSRSVPEIHSHVAGTLSKQPTNRKSRHASVATLLKTLHWLPVRARIQCKIACLCFQFICQKCMPPYISDLLRPYCPSRTLSSLDTSLLTVPRFFLETFGKRSFSVFGPTVWDSLPLSLRKKQCFTTFKKKLKPHLFEINMC